MAFRGEASAVHVSDAQVISAEVASAALDTRTVSPDDALKVKLAIGFIVAIALIDCVLYLPRLF